MLTPVIALITWTLIVWIWMYALRIPAMQAANIDADDARHPGSLVQNTINKVAIRFSVFSLSSIVLMVITVRALMAM